MKITDLLMHIVPGVDDGSLTGTLLNAPFDSNYNLSCGDAVFVAVVNGNDGKICFVVPK